MTATTTRPPRTDTTDWPTTRAGRIKMPRLDADDVQAQAKKKITTALRGKTTPADRIRALGRLNREVGETIELKGEYVDRLALSLALYDGVRGLHETIGVARETLSRLKRAALNNWTEIPPFWDETVPVRAQECGVRYYSNAAADLLPLAAEVAVARAVILAALPYRDAAISEARAKTLPDGTPNPNRMLRTEIAAMLGIDESRVTHIADRDDPE